VTRILTIRMSQLDNLWCMACRGAYDRQGRFAARPRCWNSLGTRFETHRSNCPGDDVLIYDYDLLLLLLFFFPSPFFDFNISRCKKSFISNTQHRGQQKTQNGQVMISWPPGRWTWRCAGPLGPQRGELSPSEDGDITRTAVHFQNFSDSILNVCWEFE